MAEALEAFFQNGEEEGARCDDYALAKQNEIRSPSQLISEGEKFSAKRGSADLMIQQRNMPRSLWHRINRILELDVDYAFNFARVSGQYVQDGACCFKEGS
jgi:hypothetical protein